jgi:metal transporter CNNM
VRDPKARLGDVIGQMTVVPETPGDDLIEHDLILVWHKQRRIITGSDLLGRLLRGIATVEKPAASRTNLATAAAERLQPRVAESG